MKSTDKEKCDGEGKKDFVVRLWEDHVESMLESVWEAYVLRQSQFGVVLASV